MLIEMKKKSTVINDNVADVILVSDDDDEDIDVPIICLDDDEEDDDLKINKEYKLFLDHLKDDDNLGPLFELNQGDLAVPLRYEIDSERSETRKLVSKQSTKRGILGFKAENSKIRESIQRDNRVAERRKRKFAALEAETLGDAQGEIQRDDKVCERRKKKACELKAETLRKEASLVRIEEETQRVAERRKKSIAETRVVTDASMEVNDVNVTSRIASMELNGINEIQRDDKVSEGRKKKACELKAETLASLVRIEEETQRDNIITERSQKRVAETKDGTDASMELNDVIMTSRIASMELNGERKKKACDLKAETLRKEASLVRTEEETQRDKRIAERSQKRVAETKDGTDASMELNDVIMTSRIASMKLNGGRKKKAFDLRVETLRKEASLVKIEEEKRIAERRKKSKVVTDASMEVNEVNETSRIAQMTQRNNGVFAGRRNKTEEEIVVLVDLDYMSYLKWLVDSLKDLTTKPTSNLQKDQSDSDLPIFDTPNKSTTMVPEKDELVTVKVEQDLESLPDDSSDVIVKDSPFFDGEEATPFVSSKIVINFEKESKEGERSSSCWFKTELMKDLERPYNEEEFKNLTEEASINRKMTRCRELRKGRESDYETDEFGKSYLESFDDFNKVYNQVHQSDKVRALELLRGFFFYLKNVSHDGSFKPWKV